MAETQTLASQIGQELLSAGRTMATAESCTGGNIAHLLTLTPGCSSWYNGGVVSYVNQVKINVLGVKSETIEKYTVVSGQVAEEMAMGACKATGADYAVSTTGIAGPDGGDEQNPVGTVWIGIATPCKTLSKRFVFGDNRGDNIDKFAETALRLLLDNL